MMNTTRKKERRKEKKKIEREGVHACVRCPFKKVVEEYWMSGLISHCHFHYPVCFYIVFYHKAWETLKEKTKHRHFHAS